MALPTRFCPALRRTRTGVRRTGPLAAGGRSFDPDIVSLDVCAARLSLGVRPGLLRLAAKRGLFFELVYAPIVADANARKTAAANVRTLLRYGLRSILVSGGVDAAWKARAPADVANLLSLVGVAPDAARRTTLSIRLSASSWK